jgi:hypothetical protein
MCSSGWRECSLHSIETLERLPARHCDVQSWLLLLLRLLALCCRPPCLCQLPVSRQEASLPSLIARARPACICRCRADKGGVVHAGLGKCSFSAAALLDNAGAFTSAILAARPKGVKGGTITGYLLSASLSSTMGPGIPLSVASLVATAQATKAKLE